MIGIAELLDPAETSPPWPLLKQIGIDHVVSLLEAGEQRMRFLRGVSQLDDPGVIDLEIAGAEPCWRRPALERLKRQYEDAGFTLDVIEDNPPMDKIRLGLPGSDEQIEWFCDQLRAMGELRIPVLCYNWVAVYDWARTAVDVPTRGEALVTGYSHTVMQEFPPAPEAELVTEERLWENLEAFLRQSCPWPRRRTSSWRCTRTTRRSRPIRGLGRIMRSVDNYQRLIDMVPSPVNGITLCQGNFTLMTDDLPGGHPPLRRAGEDLLRPLPGRAGDAGEVRRDLPRRGQDGHARLHAGLRGRRLRRRLRPDHVPTMEGEANDNPAY